MKPLIISLGWLGLCAIALWWGYTHIETFDIEADHEEALFMNDLWDAAHSYRASPPVKRPVPPILDQSSAYRDRLRKAEALGFRDPDDPWAA